MSDLSGSGLRLVTRVWICDSRPVRDRVWVDSLWFGFVVCGLWFGFVVCGSGSGLRAVRVFVWFAVLVRVCARFGFGF